jgi:hypothetical protein
VWRFNDYVENDRNVIEQWIAGRASIEAELDVILAHLARRPIEDWPNFYCFKWLEADKYAGLGEFRFTLHGWEQRPVGCVGRSPEEFVLLVGCAKRGGIYFPAPPHPFDVAVARRAAYDANPTSVVERIVL